MNYLSRNAYSRIVLDIYIYIYYYLSLLQRLYGFLSNRIAPV